MNVKERANAILQRWGSDNSQHAMLVSAMQEERELCAKIAEAAVDPEWPNDDISNQAKAIAADIRSGQ